MNSRIAPALFLLGLCLHAAPPDGEDAARTVPVSAIPHIAAGGGWRTTIRIPNPTRLFHEIRVETYLANGQPMEAGFGGRRGTSRTYEVPPLGVLDVDLSGAETPVDGYAMLLFLSGSTLPHTALYFHDGALQGTTGKAAGAQYLSDHFQFDNTQGGMTAVAFLVSASTLDLHHRLTCYAANGGLLGSYSFPVPASRAGLPGGYTKILLTTPHSLGATENLKGTCHFSYLSGSMTTEKNATRPVVALRFLSNGFLPLTY